jgi:hypothetical protein
LDDDEIPRQVLRLDLAAFFLRKPDEGHLILARRLVAGWVAGEKNARAEVAVALEKAGLTMEDVMAETLSGTIDPFERFDRMLASAEARRNIALHEIDRHRETLGAAMRRAVDQIPEVEFRDVETGAVGGEAKP